MQFLILNDFLLNNFFQKMNRKAGNRIKLTPCSIFTFTTQYMNFSFSKICSRSLKFVTKIAKGVLLLKKKLQSPTRATKSRTFSRSKIGSIPDSRTLMSKILFKSNFLKSGDGVSPWDHIFGTIRLRFVIKVAKELFYLKKKLWSPDNSENRILNLFQVQDLLLQITKKPRL